MTNWHSFWQNYRIKKIESDKDLLYQVGKTVRGVSVSDKIFQTLIKDIQKKLELNRNDHLLDLCCGNGVLTKALSIYTYKVTGVDFSKPYILNAKKFKCGKNISYLINDVNNMSKHNLISNVGDNVSAILLYDALAYFSYNMLDALLSNISESYSEFPRMLIGSVLYSPCKFNFYNTIPRKISFLINTFFSKYNYGIGKWWKPEEFKSLASSHKLDYLILNQPENYPTSHYRKDIFLSPKE